MNKNDADVIIIGAGISGLSCARNLLRSGIDVLILEAGNQIGGRIQSDHIDGFILDRGFQVLQTAYPEARRQLDFEKLELRPFSPGVAVRTNGKFYYISDPIRRPQDIWQSLTAPIGSIADRLRILQLFIENRLKGPEGIFRTPDMPTRDFLRFRQFSHPMIQRFFRPFFAGACLDPDIRASSRVFRYLFNIFASGDAALPAKGMAQIPAQLAETIPDDKIRLGMKAEAIETGAVFLTNGERVTGKKIVIATEAPEARRLLKRKEYSGSKAEKCLYFSAEVPPISKSFLILNGEENGLVNNIAIPTLNAPSYSDSGQHLIAAVVLGGPSENTSLETMVAEELSGWFGPSVLEWQHIKTYDIYHALPDQSPPISNPAKGFSKVEEGIYTCGEYQSLPGIQWALLSGRRTAEQIIGEDQ